MKNNLFVLIFISHAAIAQPQEIFSQYFGALRSGDRIKAERCWVPEEVQRSKKFAIIYSGIDAKYDCASPLVLSLREITQRRITVMQGDVVDDGPYARMPVRFASGNDTLQTEYYFVMRNNFWRITSPLFLFTKGWKTVTTKYSIVHYSDDRRLNNDALQELDSYIESLCRKFHLSESAVKHLQKEKLLYYLGNDETVKKITGYTTKGIANLQFDAVVSSYLPHYHELTHLFVNYLLKELPLYTLPWMQEGTAVCSGGRWGKSPGVMLQMGNFLFDQQMFSLDDLLTYHGFHSTIGSADLSYPASGLFVQFLLEHYGAEKFLHLYRSLSGSSERIKNLSADSVHSVITKITSASWQQIESDFQTFRKQYRYAGIVPGTADRTRHVRRLNSAQCSVQISETDSVYQFDVQLDSVHSNISVLFSSRSIPASNAYKSFLFAEHFPSGEYHGEKYSFRMTVDEAGLYDYHTNVLLAKYVVSFSPGTEYLNSADNTLHVMLQKNLIQNNISGYTLNLRSD